VRLIRQRRGAEREIERCCAEWQQNERHDGDGPAPPRRRSHIGRRCCLRVGRGDEPARNLDLRARRLVLSDQARCTVAFDLRELVAIDRDVAAPT
jgi:hypothetical protein